MTAPRKAKNSSSSKPSRRSAKAQEEIIKDYLSARSSHHESERTARQRTKNSSLRPFRPSLGPGKAEEEIREEPLSQQSSTARQEEFAALIPKEMREIPLVVPALSATTGWIGFLNRALSWLRTGSVVSKQLRVSETVALGEKRFVAIVHAEGHKFLIGGSATGVSLLTRLDERTSSAAVPETTAVLVEATQ